MDAPFPYFGGKSSVAHVVWDALGDVAHYIEPFCGSAAVLLNRPTWHKRKMETVNDADGHIANVWRAMQAAPDVVAKWCDWPVNHADLMARKCVLNRESESLVEALSSDDAYYDAKLAGYYVWAASCWIGRGLICPGQRPHLADAGMGVHKLGQIPHLASGMGVHKLGERSPATTGVGVQEPYNTNLYVWFRNLAERLRYVRVVCGDWSRVCGGDWQDNQGTVGIFFDPPYSDAAQRDERVYATDSLDVAHDVREWCVERGTRSTYRIILAGYVEEHESLCDHGWRVHSWAAQGGYAHLGNGAGKANRHREALFMSPHCLQEETLFA